MIILFSLNILRHAYSANDRSCTSPAVCWRRRCGHEVAITEHSLELFIHKPEDRNKEYKVREGLQKSLQRRFNLEGWIEGTRAVNDTTHLIPKPNEHKILGVNRELKQERRRRLRERRLKSEVALPRSLSRLFHLV